MSANHKDYNVYIFIIITIKHSSKQSHLLWSIYSSAGASSSGSGGGGGGRSSSAVMPSQANWRKRNTYHRVNMAWGWPSTVTLNGIFRFLLWLLLTLEFWRIGGADGDGWNDRPNRIDFWKRLLGLGENFSERGKWKERNEGMILEVIVDLTLNSTF